MLLGGKGEKCQQIPFVMRYHLYQSVIRAGRGLHSVPTLLDAQEDKEEGTTQIKVGIGGGHNLKPQIYIGQNA